MGKHTASKALVALMKRRCPSGRAPMNIFMKQKNWFTIRRLGQYIYAIAEFCHQEKVVSYLVAKRDRAILFDTGLGYENIAKIIGTITPFPITVFLTHAHWDHIGGASAFSSVYLYDHPFERTRISEGFRSSAIPELSENSYFFPPFAPKPYHVIGRKTYQTLRDKQILVIGGNSIEVIHTPGHTPGSTCYFLKDQNILIAGDTLYPGPLYAQLPESDIEAYAQSLAKLTKITNSRTRILPGHNATSCSYRLLIKASALMKSVAADHRFFKNEPREVKGDGFSILL